MNISDLFMISKIKNLKVKFELFNFVTSTNSFVIQSQNTQSQRTTKPLDQFVGAGENLNPAG